MSLFKLVNVCFEIYSILIIVEIKFKPFQCSTEITENIKLKCVNKFFLFY